jgi:hypothetical protein
MSSSNEENGDTGISEDAEYQSLGVEAYFVHEDSTSEESSDGESDSAHLSTPKILKTPFQVAEKHLIKQLSYVIDVYHSTAT